MQYIGIDTGENTGLAVWDSRSESFILLTTTRLYSALFAVKRLADEVGRENVTVVFEDARQRKWIPKEKSVSEYRGKLMGAGSVKRDAAIWEEFCKGERIPFEMVAPSKGLTKWSAEAFRKVTGWEGRTSNHARDAGMLVFGR